MAEGTGETPEKIEESQRKLQELKEKIDAKEQTSHEQKPISEKKQPRIRIYTTQTCPYCKMAKEYFRQKNLVYEELDVSKNENAFHEMVHLTEQMSVPVIVIGRYILLGFDAQTIEKIISEKSNNIGYA